MRNKFSLFLREPRNNNVLIRLRERLLQIMLYCSFAAGTVLFFPALIPVLQKGVYSTIIIYGLLYAWTILITFDHRLPYRLRAIGWLGMLFAFGLINLVNSGFNVDSGLFLVTFIAMAILLMDLPAGLIALALGSIAVSILGILNTNNNNKLPVGLPQSDPLLWIIGGIIFFLMGALLIYSLTIVVDGLQKALANATRLTEELGQTNQSLRMSEARYRALVETSPDVVLLLDLLGNVIMSNQVGLSLFGYEHLEEVAGKNLVDFVAVDDRQRTMEAFQSILDTGGLKDFDIHVFRKDGSTFYAEYSASLLRDESNRPQVVIGVGRDITARKEAERLLQEGKEALAVEVAETSAQLQQTASRLEELVSHGPIVIYSLRASDHVVNYMSDNVSAMLGYEASQFLEDSNFWRTHVHPEDKERVIALVDHPDNQARVTFDYRFLKIDGNYCWIRSERMLRRDAQGNPLEFVGSLMDITERKKAEETLQFSEARYHSLYESMMDPYVQVGLDGRIELFNQSYQAMLGYEADELRSLTYMDLTPEKWHAFEAGITESQIWTRGYSDIYEKEYIRKDGSVFPVELRSALMHDSAGKPYKMWAIVRDISERKKAQEALRISEERYRSLYESMMDGYATADMDGRILQFNDAYQKMLGYEAEELRSLTYYELTPKKWHRYEAEISETQVLRRGYSDVYEKEYQRKDGTTFPVELRVVLIRDEAGNPAGMWALVRDISERKKTEEALRISEARYRSLYESMMDGYSTADMDGRILQFNEAFQKMLGYEPSELRSLTYHDLTPKKWQEYEAEIIEKQVIKRGYSDVYEKEYQRKDGTTFPVELRAVLIRDEAGNPAGMWALIRDISERKKTEEALRDSEVRYRELVDASMQGVIVLQDMRVVYTNQAVTEALGYTREELNQLTRTEIGQFVHPQDQHVFLERLQPRQESVPNMERYSLRVIHKNGEIRWIEARTVPIMLEGKPAMMTTAIDVTEIRRVEAELQESERSQRSILNAYDAIVFLADANGIIISANDKFVQRLGIRAEAVAGTFVHGIFTEDITRQRRVYYNQVVSSGKPVIFEDRRGGGWFENSFYPVLDESGKVVRVAAFIRDITEQRRVTEALRISEEKYRTLAEASHDLIFIINHAGIIEYVNSYGAQFLGQPAHLLVGQPRERFFPGDTSQHQIENIRHVFESGEANFAESANVFPDQTVWLSTWLVPLKNEAGEVTSIMGVSRDITERKQAEEELREARDLLEERVAKRTQELSESQDKLRSLTAQTVKTQEEERRTISRELHDDAGQALITLQYSLAAVQNELPATETTSHKRLSDSLKTIEQTMQHIRLLAHSLRPPVLDIGGINLSLQDFCREQSEQTRIPIFYQGQDIPGLSDEISISLYRFVQEGLANVLKHAHASQVKIKLQHKKGEISISVDDNGRGMEDATQTRGMGLDGMRERLKLLDGRLETHSTKGRGTRLVAFVPWPRPDMPSAQPLN